MAEALLKVEDLVTAFDTDAGLLTAVDGVSFSVERGKTLGIVGESGCGKSVSAFSITRLLPQPHGKILSGRILFEGRDLLNASEEELHSVRGKEIGIIFQEPMAALDPVQRVGRQLTEAVMIHEQVTPKEARRRVIEMLAHVRIPAPETRVDEYPHQLSGGMRQRVMIAMALIHKPKLLIADEPTTALDVTVQAQILELISDLQREMGMGVILITHDLGVIAETCDEVAVMYAGRVIERAPVRDLFANPRHAYTRGLLASIPRLDHKPKTHLPVIPGVVPSLEDWKPGCRFADRSGKAHTPEQLNNRFSLSEVAPGHWVEACPVCAGIEIAKNDVVSYTSHHDQQSRRDSAPSFADAQSHLERSEGPSVAQQSDDRSAKHRQQQLQCLASYAQAKGCLIAADKYSGPVDQGAEHRVFFEPDRSRAIKITNTGQCGMTFVGGQPVAAMADEYLKRWQLHNHIFGDDVEFEGVVEAPSGFSLVVSQQWIVGEAPPTERISEFMASLGFAATDVMHDYYRAADNLAVLDCHEGNFILGIDGQMYAIDVIPVTADEALKQTLGVL